MLKNKRTDINEKNIFFIITLIIITILSCYSLLLNNQLNECNNKETTTNNTQPIIQSSINIYNCKFTTTYRIVNLLDNYTTENSEYSYIIVDKYQEHTPISHLIPTKLKNNLEINKFYEFTYYIKGTGNIENIYDIINNIKLKSSNNTNLNITLSIKETNKLGNEKMQENICS